MLVVSAELMKQIEQECATRFQFPEKLIIENVGREGSQVLSKWVRPYGVRSFYFLVGGGNNGTDALAIARHLVNQGEKCSAVIAKIGQGLWEEELQRARAFGVETLDLVEFWGRWPRIKESAVVIDGLIGTGHVSRPLPDSWVDLLETLNAEERVLKVALDMPTGIDASTGKKGEAALQANCTLAIGLPKRGHFIGEGYRHRGELLVLEAGLPRAVVSATTSGVAGTWHLLQGELGPGNKKDKGEEFSHKYDFGHLYVIGGSPGLAGAPVLAAMAGFNSGCGLVTIGTWRESFGEMLAQKPAEIMTWEIDDGQLEGIEGMLKADTVVLGPGLGFKKFPAACKNLVERILREYQGALVLDADALAVLDNLEVLRQTKAKLFLTPHQGELARLLRVELPQVLERPAELVQKFAQDFQLHLLLKGPVTMIATPQGEIYLHDQPNPGLAQAGTGDVLAGIIGGLLAKEVRTLKKKNLWPDKVNSGLTKNFIAGVLLHKKTIKNLQALMGMTMIGASGLAKGVNQ
jgi:hydroxyethylthiazole kinase-like uncharacterized protein yjeF